MKINLPVIILRGIVLLPNNDIRLEFENDNTKNIIDISELFHDNKVLVVSQENLLEEMPDINELEKYGVVAKISHKVDLPNDKVRVTVTGLYRADVYEYLNHDTADDVLESIIIKSDVDILKEKEEQVFIRKLYREMELYIKALPYVSNSVLSLINNITSLDKMTDIIIPYLQIDNKRTMSYLREKSSFKRFEMILEDIYREQEMFQIEKRIDTKIRKELDDNQREFILREKIKVIKEELGDTSLKEVEIEELKSKIDNINPPKHIKQKLFNELKRYELLNSSSPEINTVRTYIDWLINLPWNIYTNDQNDLEEVRGKLDDSHNGIEKVKTRIIEYLAVKQMTKSLRSPIICLVGPPGVGKTTLAFSIAKSMNRNFVKISVGGITDEAELIGHRRTYIGANPGRIIQSMKKAKSMNPVFLIDEIDKMRYSYKGDPASTLLEILDPEQNKYFSDNYIEEEFDLSKVMFIVTANHIEEIPEALKDRLEIISLSGYTEYEKLDIAKKYLLPKICKEHGVNVKGIDIKDQILLHLIRYYTKEAGVRELERQLSSIIRKIVTSMVTKHIIMNKVIIDKKKINEYLGHEKYSFIGKNKHSEIGVVNGLAYTQFGGDVLPIEANYFKGSGNLVLTGSLGDVMKESALIALNYIKSNHKYFHIDYDLLTNNDIHIHLPEGAIPKDGPSAGITLVTTMISLFTGLKIDSSIAMTGEVTLRGKVLEIGGLREKSVGAHRNGIKRVILPFENKKDLEEVPEEIRDDIEYIFVKDYKDVIRFLKKKVSDENEEINTRRSRQLSK